MGHNGANISHRSWVTYTCASGKTKRNAKQASHLWFCRWRENLILKMCNYTAIIKCSRWILSEDFITCRVVVEGWNCKTECTSDSCRFNQCEPYEALMWFCHWASPGYSLPDATKNALCCGQRMWIRTQLHIAGRLCLTSKLTDIC